MLVDPQRLPKVLELYLEITQYPILADEIRARMRAEIFARGVIRRADFEQEAEERAILSQEREGVTAPLTQEPADIWSKRLSRVRDQVTDFYFAHNIPHERFEEIVEEVLGERVPAQEVVLTFNPEMAPWDVLFAKADEYLSAPAESRALLEPSLKEIRVVLIKSMVSDQLRFVGLAKDLLTVPDLKEIRRRRIGRGKIGGKAAGMLLAWKGLQETTDEGTRDLLRRVVIPDSHFVGADVSYDFQALNGLSDYVHQKYKSETEIRAEYPQIRRLFAEGRFPPDIVEALREVIADAGKTPMIVRSSSLLEDNFETSFAGKYESRFCPNQGTLEENLAALTHAISQVYASVVNPDAISYRQRMGLIDYDERMAILLQKVQGTLYEDRFFPALAGVGFSHNPFRWNPRIRREEGFLRMVWGLGTRAVDRLENDYPRMVALSHPRLRAEMGAQAIRKYSQHYVDVIDLTRNKMVTLPVRDVLDVDYPGVAYLASVDSGDYIQPMFALSPMISADQLLLTFDNLFAKTDFCTVSKIILQRLEQVYGRAVDIEFTVDIIPGHPKPDFLVHLLQCRPQSSRAHEEVKVPDDVPEADTLFSADRMVPQGRASGIRYVVYVDPEAYGTIPSQAEKLEVARVTGRLNARLASERFILMGPGRWGSSNPELGVKITYADIHNSMMLIELAWGENGAYPEASYGTHFFQDLVEAQIYPLILCPQAQNTRFDLAFFRGSPNALADLLPDDAGMADRINVIDLLAVTGKQLEVVMNAEEERALGYLSAP